MGVYSRSGRVPSSSSYDSPVAVPAAGNPNPSDWKLIREQQVGAACVLEVSYPDCRNYEGRKIMIFRASGLGEIMRRNSGKLDPHFSANQSYLSPVARFEPTSGGWAMALECARSVR